MRELKIGTSSVRGVVGQAFHPRLMIDFACAFGTWVEGRPIVLGRDPRKSSPMVRSAVLSGLIATGCRVLDLGVASTPLVSFAVRELGCAGGICITGGHNDSEWNALKFIGPDGCLLNSARSEELFDIYHAGGFRVDSAAGRVAALRGHEVVQRYLDLLFSAVDGESIHASGLKLVIDFCGGSLGPMAQVLGDRLGCELVSVNAESTAEFPHPPEPRPEHMRQVSDAVRAAGATLGAALNVDGDRLALVDEHGVALSEELTLPLATLARFRRRSGPIATNCSTSGSVEELAQRWGQPVFRAAVGESFVMDKAMEEGAVIAGEGSGGVALLPWSATFDALHCLIVIAELMSAERASLSELVGGIPVRVMRKGAWRCPPAQAYGLVERFPAAFEGAKLDALDGVRLVWEDRWVHARVSRTEPVLRVIVEGPSAAIASALFEQSRSVVELLLAGRSSDRGQPA
jgi:phosphomannomutase